MKHKKERSKPNAYGASTLATISSLLQVTPKDCYFCAKSSHIHQVPPSIHLTSQSMTSMIKKALYSKYSAS